MKKSRNDRIVFGVIGLAVVAAAIVYFVWRPGRADWGDPETEPILRLGGFIDREEKGPDQPIVTIDLGRTAISDKDLRRVGACRRLRKLDLMKTRIGDEGLYFLSDLAELETLILYETEITDAGIKHLKGFTKLRELNLSGTGRGITGKEIHQLKQLEHLETLDVSFTELTDEGL